MKRYIKSTTYAKYYITVSVYKVEADSIAATEYLKHLDTIPESRRISEEELEKLNDVISSVISVLHVNEFDVLPGHQSADGYTWYAPFYPVLNTGEELNEYLIVFRLSNHYNKGISEESSVIDTKVMKIIKSFTLGSSEYPTVVALLRAVKDTCNDIKYAGYDAIKM